MSSGEVIIYGAGGFAREVCWLLQEIHASSGLCRPAYYVVNDATAVRDADLPVFAASDLMASQLADDIRILIGIGDPATRRKIALELPKPWIHDPVFAIGSTCGSVQAGPGTIVCTGSILTVNVELGRHVHVNLDCTIGHDCKIADYVTLSPGVHVSGCVEIGEGAFIGTGANILPGTREKPLHIGRWSKVGAGAVVTKDVPERATVVGVPARSKDEVLLTPTAFSP